MILWCKILFLIIINFNANSGISIDDDGGYKDIIVGISPNLQKFEVEPLLSQLKVLFRNSSEALFKASEKKAFFKDIIFALPKEYETWISNSNLLDSKDTKSFRKPNVFITDNDIFQNPYTVQHQGCAKPGLRINIPSDFLLKKGSNKKASSFVRQWAHYRYGVFDESGFSNDLLYPACYRVPGSDKITVSDCTNEKAVYEFEKKSRGGYDSFPNVCTPVPVSDKNDHIVSSIMTNIDFPEIKYFCDNDLRPHNRNAPTKQNALCREKSAWEIISSHDDFKLERKETKNVMPGIKYVVESNPNFVVAVDTSTEMDLNDRMTLTLNAFSYFVLYDLPKNSTLRLIDMKGKDDIVEIKNIMSEEDARRIINMFPETDGQGDICVHCTIQKLLEDLKLDDINDIVIITATDITSSWIDNIKTILKSNKVALHVIYFEKKLRHAPFLEKVAKISGGSFFYIPDAFPTGSPISSLTMLYEAFRSIYEYFSWINRKHVLVDQMTFSTCSPKCVLSFPSDRSIQTLRVIITGQEFGGNSPVLRKSIILDNGLQHFTSGNDSFIYKAEVPAYVITVQYPQTGTWNLSFERKIGFTKPVIAIVRATSTGYGDIINMQSWISSDENKSVDNLARPPITIFSEIKKNNNPVTDVKVTALIHQESYNTEWSLELKDSGDGDPDITKDDGIFSRYLTDIKESGYYSITVSAQKNSLLKYHDYANERSKEMNCCGSFIPDYLSFDSGSFKRVITYQSFYISEERIGKTYPPRRVVDLRLERIVMLSNNIKCYVLNWTAPGENYDNGRALVYDIRVFNTRENALNDFDNSYVSTIQMLNIQGPLLEPEEAGTNQSALVQLKNLTSGTYFMALKTVSHSGKTSDVSNVVQLSHTGLFPLHTGTGISDGEYFTFPINGTTETIIEDEPKEPTNLGLAIGLTCGFLFLFLIIGLILLVYFRRSKKTKKDQSSSLRQNTKKTESKDALCHTSGNRGGNISIISPVNSWGADSLISHFQTIQQQKTNEESGMLSIPQSREETDSISLTSSKYSYNNKIEQNSAIYDPIYYHQTRSQDELNYSYNPTYTPFDPMYNSSLRRLDSGDMVLNLYAADNISYSSYSLQRNPSSKLKTDV